MTVIFLIRCLFAGRSREGAWIEIRQQLPALGGIFVAPARERGLKSTAPEVGGTTKGGRSREGAWIEIPLRWYQL